jgi:aspartate aminotransferase-like enzyme
MNMPKGKPWTNREVKKLRRLVAEHSSLVVTAAELKRSEGAIRQKCRRLGLEVVVNAQRTCSTTSDLKIPETVKTLEEVLKILTSTLDVAGQKGLDKTEIQRLQVIATIARTYETIFTNYVDYRSIEQKLRELQSNYARLVRKTAKNNAAK